MNMLIGGWFSDYFQETFFGMFIRMFDNVVYKLVSISYNIFYYVSRVDIFSTESGLKMYTDISKRLYTILGIVMIFVFAYQMLMMIIDPEKGGKGGGSSGQLVKDIVISIVALILAPTLFHYMALFQQHVLEDGTIANIILGANEKGDVGKNPMDNNDNLSEVVNTPESAGNRISLIVFTSMYHPVGLGYTDLISGNKTCPSGTSSDVCESWYDAYDSWLADSSFFGISPFTKKGLIKKISDDDGMEYMIIISTGVGLLVCWFLIGYSIDIGARVFKLAVLELVAPVPIILRCIPKQKAIFDKWWPELLKCYMEIFVRLAVIFIAVYMCMLVPDLVKAVMTSGTGEVSLVSCIATVCLIIGLLSFAKEAPALMKGIFSGGSLGLLNGLNLKGGLKSRDYAMRTVGAGVSMAGSIPGMVKGFKQGRANALQNEGPGSAGGLGANLRGLAGGALGAGRGASNMLKAGARSMTTEGAKTYGDMFGAAKKNIVKSQEDLARGINKDASRYEDGDGSYFTGAGRQFIANGKDKKDQMVAFLGGEQTKLALQAKTLADDKAAADRTLDIFKGAIADTDARGKEKKTQLSTDGYTTYKGVTYGTTHVAEFNNDGTVKYYKSKVDQSLVDSDGYSVDANGHYVNSDGQVVASQAQAERKNTEMKFFTHSTTTDSNGKVLSYTNTNGQTYDSGGYQINANGEYLKADGTTTTSKTEAVQIDINDIVTEGSANIRTSDDLKREIDADINAIASKKMSEDAVGTKATIKASIKQIEGTKASLNKGQIDAVEEAINKAYGITDSNLKLSLSDFESNISGKATFSDLDAAAVQAISKTLDTEQKKANRQVYIEQEKSNSNKSS